MKRLIDQGELLPEEQQLADLFRVAPVFETDPFRKRRVLVSLLRVHNRPRVRFWLRPIAALVLLVSGSAAAAIGHSYVARGGSWFSSRLPSSAPSARAPVKPALPTPPKRASTAAPSASSEFSDASVVASARTADPATARPAPKPARARSSSGEDATHVAEAIQALRADKDPSRAQGLLNDYLKAQPNGVLSEDALALSIEAASARRDPNAAEYAKRYLAKFPHGKYRALASRAVAQAGH